jgi:hypothetical protein
MPASPCVEKTNLLSEYQKATEIYSLAVSELSQKLGIVRQDEYQQLSDFAENCRYRSGDARTRLERHIAEHGC